MKSCLLVASLFGIVFRPIAASDCTPGDGVFQSARVGPDGTVETCYFNWLPVCDPDTPDGNMLDVACHEYCNPGESCRVDKTPISSTTLTAGFKPSCAGNEMTLASCSCTTNICKAPCTDSDSTGEKCLLKVVCLPGETTCEPGWYKHQDNCYKFVPEMLYPWADSCSACENEYGAKLLKIDSNDELTFIRSTIENNSDLSSVNYWTSGFKSNKSPIEWSWAADNSAMTVKAWAVNEPNNRKGVEDCVNILQTKGYLFNDSKCTKKQGFVCEVPIQ